MSWPGENLLIKLWETLAEKGVGSLLRPWQLRREGIAQVDVRRYELLALAEAERDVEKIRNGTLKLVDAKYTLSLTDTQNPTGRIAGDSATKQSSTNVATNSLIADALRKEINVAKAVVQAETELKEDSSPVTDKKVDTDWLYRWRDYAGDVSSDELQAIWGRILAGESKAPGTYSFRLLDFVRNLSKEESQL